MDDRNAPIQWTGSTQAAAREKDYREAHKQKKS